MHTRRIAPALPALLALAALLCAIAAAPAGAQSLENNPLLLDVPREPVQAMDFTAETLAGRQVRLSDFRGQVVLLNFWATWCVPCLLEMPAMDRLNAKLAGRPFKMLAINQAEERATVQKFAEERRFSFELVLDPIGEIGSTYGANRLPMTYIVDRKGFVIRRAVGPREWDSEAALHLFDQLLGDEPRPQATPAADAGGLQAAQR